MRRAYWRWASMLIMLIAYALLVAVPAARVRIGTFSVYYTAAHILTHQPWSMPRVYDDAWFAEQINRVGIPNVRDIFNLNPPTMSLLALPLVSLSPTVARLAWIPLALACVGGGLLLLMRRLPASEPWVVWVLPLVLLSAPVVENFALGQMYVILFLLLCLFIWGEGCNRSWIAGGALGLLLILKTAGVWLCPLLLFTRRWRALGWATLTVALVVFFTLPWIGLETWQIYFRELPRLAVDPVRYVTAYQTTTSLFGHLLIYDASLNPTPVADWPLVARVLMLIVPLSTLLFSARWARFEQPATRTLTLALFTSLMVTHAPVAEGYHYALVLPALGVAGWWLTRIRVTPLLWGVLLVATLLICAPLPYKWPRLETGAWALLAYPRVYGAYMLWGVLGYALRSQAGAR